MRDKQRQRLVRLVGWLNSLSPLRLGCTFNTMQETCMLQIEALQGELPMQAGNNKDKLTASSSPPTTIEGRP